MDECFDFLTKKGYVPTKTQSNLFFVALNHHIRSLGFKHEQFGISNNTYSLWYNFLNLNLYYLVIKKIRDFRERNSVAFDEKAVDLYTDLESLADSLMLRIDPYLRLQFQRRGVTVIQNTYTGFDTEYELKNASKHLNQLLSVQIATQTRTLIKIPLYNTYDISYVHPLTSDISTFYKPESLDGGDKNTELRVINESLKTCVENIREVKSPTLKKINQDLISKFLEIEGLTYFEDPRRDQIVFSLPLTSLSTKILYPEAGYAFKEVVKLSSAESLDKNRESYLKVLEVFFGMNYTFASKSLVTWYDKTKLKPRIRTTLTFETGDKLSLTIVKNIYICAHYSSADLSMMSDFNDFKNELNIVNKSFVTLGKPLVIEGINVYIRDTVLLAPAGVKSLNQIGSLYEGCGDYSKIEISKEDKNNMSKLLARDKKLFESYAIKDSVITLKHALSMEEFNFGLKKLGVPITLSSVGRNFVFDQ